MNLKLFILFSIIFINQLIAQQVHCDDYYNRGVQLYGEKDYENAKKQFNAARDECPNSRKKEIESWIINSEKEKRKDDSIHKVDDSNKRRQYKIYLDSANSSIKNKHDFESAIVLYQAALNYSNGSVIFAVEDSAVEEKIKECFISIDRIKLHKAQELCRIQHHKADSLFDNAKYKEAKNEYQSILQNCKILDKNTISNKILLCKNKLLSSEYISSGDDLIDRNEYIGAFLSYQKAYKLGIDTILARRKIRNITEQMNKGQFIRYDTKVQIAEEYIKYNDIYDATLVLTKFHRPYHNLTKYGCSPTLKEIASKINNKWLHLLDFYLFIEKKILIGQNIYAQNENILNGSFYWNQGSINTQSTYKSRGYYKAYYEWQDFMADLAISIGINYYIQPKWSLSFEANTNKNEYLRYEQYIKHPILKDTFLVYGQEYLKYSSCGIFLKRRIENKTYRILFSPYMGLTPIIMRSNLIGSSFRTVSDTIIPMIVDSQMVYYNLGSYHLDEAEEQRGGLYSFNIPTRKYNIAAIIGFSTEFRLWNRNKIIFDVYYQHSLLKINNGVLFPFKNEWNKSEEGWSKSAFPNTPLRLSAAGFRIGYAYELWHRKKRH